MQIENMVSSNGNTVPNQFIIRNKGVTWFQSYQTIIAKRKDGKVYLDKNWDYSTTTGKYRNIFLGETKKETERKIKAGIYQIVDLNS